MESKQGVSNCKRCKCEIIGGTHCSPCAELIRQQKIDKFNNRKLSKYKATKEYGISLVKKYADPRCWCSTHANCFRCNSPTEEGKSRGESEAHIDAKFERFKYHRLLGRTVFCELRLKEGFGRPDLIVIDKGFVFAEEIVCSEGEASIINKKNKYPFPINTYKSR